MIPGIFIRHTFSTCHLGRWALRSLQATISQVKCSMMMTWFWTALYITVLLGGESAMSPLIYPHKCLVIQSFYYPFGVKSNRLFNCSVLSIMLLHNAVVYSSYTTYAHRAASLEVYGETTHAISTHYAKIDKSANSVLSFRVHWMLAHISQLSLFALKMFDVTLSSGSWYYRAMQKLNFSDQEMLRSRWDGVILKGAMYLV